MRSLRNPLLHLVPILGCLAVDGAAQTPLTWKDVLARYKAGNPTLRAGQIGIEESRKDEITAHLRPNPQLSLSVDAIPFAAPADGSGRFDNLTPVTSLGYLIELGHKRQLRLESARGATAMTVSGQADLERTQTFALRGAFVSLLHGGMLGTRPFVFQAVLTVACYPVVSYVLAWAQRGLLTRS